MLPSSEVSEDATTERFARVGDAIRELFRPEPLPSVDFEVLWNRLWTRIIEEDEWDRRYAKSVARLPVGYRRAFPKRVRSVLVVDDATLAIQLRMR